MITIDIDVYSDVQPGETIHIRQRFTEEVFSELTTCNPSLFCAQILANIERVRKILKDRAEKSPDSVARIVPSEFFPEGKATLADHKIDRFFVRLGRDGIDREVDRKSFWEIERTERGAGNTTSVEHINEGRRLTIIPNPPY